jgi:excisionase family DNA binding protein
MPNTNVPITAAQEAAKKARSAVMGAVYSGGSPDTIRELLDVAIQTAIIRATENPPFYSYGDLATRYGVSRKTVEAWEIPEYKFGRTIRFRREDVLAWERERAQT